MNTCKECLCDLICITSTKSRKVATSERGEAIRPSNYIFFLRIYGLRIFISLYQWLHKNIGYCWSEMKLATTSNDVDWICCRLRPESRHCSSPPWYHKINPRPEYICPEGVLRGASYQHPYYSLAVCDRGYSDALEVHICGTLVRVLGTTESTIILCGWRCPFAMFL
jgi:hypothetical protein